MRIGCSQPHAARLSCRTCLGVNLRHGVGASKHHRVASHAEQHLRLQQVASLCITHTLDAHPHVLFSLSPDPLCIPTNSPGLACSSPAQALTPRFAGADVVQVVQVGPSCPQAASQQTCQACYVYTIGCAMACTRNGALGPKP